MTGREYDGPVVTGGNLGGTPLDEPDELPTGAGLEDVWGSGHVAGPFDDDEMAELEEAAKARESA